MGKVQFCIALLGPDGIFPPIQIRLSRRILITPKSASVVWLDLRCCSHPVLVYRASRADDDLRDGG